MANSSEGSSGGGVHHLMGVDLTAGAPTLGSPTMRVMTDAIDNYSDAEKPLGFLVFAEQFYQASQELQLKEPSLSWPRYFLVCHAIELFLKAFLCKHGVSSDELQKKFGHKLDCLLTETKAKGLILTKTAEEDIKRLHEPHKKCWHRYPKEKGKPVFPIEQFEPTARELHARVSEAICAPNIGP